MSFSDLIKKSLALVEKHEKGENKVKKDNEKTLTQFLEWETLSTQTQYQLVSKEVEKNWHFPTLVVNNLLKHKSRLEHELGQLELSALTLLQSQALTFRHHSIGQYCSRLDKDKTDEAAKDNLNILSFTRLTVLVLSQERGSQSLQGTLEYLRRITWTIMTVENIRRR